MADPKHLPYEEEAHVITDIMNFIFEKLPHSYIVQFAELFDLRGIHLGIPCDPLPPETIDLPLANVGSDARQNEQQATAQIGFEGGGWLTTNAVP